MLKPKRVKALIDKKAKKPWVKIEIYKVALNPEQAVIACCDVALLKPFAASLQCTLACQLTYASSGSSS